MVVDLPAPLGPRNPKKEPRGTSRFTPSTAAFRPYAFFRSRTRIAGTDIFTVYDVVSSGLGWVPGPHANMSATDRVTMTPAQERGISFGVAAAITSVFFINFCATVFQCGCAALWSGGDAHCNVHS